MALQDRYLEDEVLSADPVKLIALLYQGARDRVSEARRHLAGGEIEARSRAIGKANDILAELTGSLDHARGGELSQRLAALYEYMQARLLEANLRQQDAPLVEVLGLLATLQEAWRGIARPVENPVPEAAPWSVVAEPAYVAQSWSF